METLNGKLVRYICVVGKFDYWDIINLKRVCKTLRYWLGTQDRDWWLKHRYEFALNRHPLYWKHIEIFRHDYMKILVENNEIFLI